MDELAEKLKREKVERMRRKRERGARQKLKKREMAQAELDKQRALAREEQSKRRQSEARRRSKEIERAQKERIKEKEDAQRRAAQEQAEKVSRIAERERKLREQREKLSFASLNSKKTTKQGNESRNTQPKVPAHKNHVKKRKENRSSTSKDKHALAAKREGDTQNKEASKAPMKSDGWVLVHTEDGSPYYYHSLTRQTRWEKPEGVVLEKMEARIQEQEAKRERKQRERVKDLREAEERRKTDEARHLKSSQAIEKAVTTWQESAKRAPRCLESPSAEHSYLYNLLRFLIDVVPSEVIQSSNRGDSLTLIPDSAKSSPSSLKKVYFKVLRVIHPDKVSQSVQIENRIQMERVFNVLNTAFSSIRSA